MTEHATSLELDEAAAGMAAGPVRAHVDACAACKAELARVAAGRDAVLADPRFRQTFAKLPVAASRRAWAWLFVPAAAAALIIGVRASPGLRPKGSASIELRAEAGHDPASPRVGDTIELRISSGRYRYALVASVEGDGNAALLLPSSGNASGELSPGSHTSVRLRVTPGAVRIVAVFSDERLTVSDAIAARKRPGVQYNELFLRPVP